MNRKFILLIVLGLLLAVPIGMVIRNEMLLADEGSIYKFTLQPIDPSDPVRGKYIILRYNTMIELDEPIQLQNGEPIYVEVKKDENGWAYFSNVSTTPPDHSAYFKTTVNYGYERTVNINVPFDKYFLNENLAPLAESSYAELTRHGEEFYAEVSITNGEALLRGVYYMNRPLIDHLREMQVDQ
ncbi:MAG TPA: GDYXXLXY domain-containing protein [Flavobacteriales bacterium]|nr:GDYXXLXY domain-containing protein [Flavobacteriales bacterium]HRE98090.1 GDYXXLXY domain-containing protein [Flavobacteriales bacterium]HRJ34894.1 GDYXXLXY domain-containing protein [Flavobacteriales bacterium]HRJ39466.1 GDYXXLXY domain-containing protein [Flavobacteriales bacterium]